MFRYILYFIVFFILVRIIGRPERKRRAEEQRRRSTICHFSDGISEESFTSYVEHLGERINRIEDVRVIGPVIYCTVRSQSGLSTWDFTIDFNDYGHLTGTYWLTTENRDSSIPEHMADTISSAIRNNAILPDGHVSRMADYNNPPSRDEPVSDMASSHSLAEQFHAKKKWKRNLFLVFLLVSIIIAGFSYYEYKKLMPLGFDNSELVGIDYKTAKSKIEGKGFTYVKINNIADLSLNSISEDGLVTEVKVGWKTHFRETYRYPSNLPVQITYHSLEPINVPMSSSDTRGMHYKDVISAFKDAGFIHVSEDVEYDIITGWLAEDGEVKSVAIGNDKSFSESSTYRPDAPVVVTYHTLKENQPD